MKFIILLITFITVSQGQYLNMNWLDDLMGSINQLNRNIESNVQNLNQQILKSVKHSMTNVDNYNQNIAQQFDRIRVPVSMNTVTNGQTLIMNNGGGNSQFILSGHDVNGKPYYRAIEQVVNNNILKHVEKVYNSTTDKFDTFGYTLDLNDPNSKPIPIVK